MTPDRIYNIGIFAHVDAGKTTLTEQFLYLSGALRKAGSVDTGTAQTDWLPIERERGISVRAASVSFSYDNRRINLIDTPGHTDFAGEAERSLTAIDGAILVLSAVEGVQSHTENLWRALYEAKKPVLLFINKIDRAGSRFDALCEEIPRVLAFRDERLLKMSEVSGEGGGNCAVQTAGGLREGIIDLVSEYDDTLAERYLSGEVLSEKTLSDALASGVRIRKIIPVFAGSAQKAVGADMLLEAAVTLLPPASERQTDTLSATVFKIEHDKTMGKIAHVRLFGGELHARDAVKTRSGEEKISQIRKYSGQKYTDAGVVTAGDIAVLCGVDALRAMDTIGAGGVLSPHLANPFLSVKVSPETDAELMPLLAAVRELSDEDPLLDCKWEKTEREILISCTGKIQLEVLAALLVERYGLRAVFSEPSVIYKETPSKAGYGYEAYTMPKPCWAVVRFLFEPLPRGAGVVYDGGRIPSNTCFYKYQEHIRRSFFANLEQGLLGWEVTDFKATLVDAQHHTIHTHPLDFFVATPMAIMDGLRNTGTTLLEPYLRIRLSADAEFLGKVIGDVTMMRGTFDAPVIHGDGFTLEASVPAASSLDYPVRFASLTHGKGVFFSNFDGYRDCPPELGKTARRRGPNPLDRSKWILYARGAMGEEDYTLIH